MLYGLMIISCLIANLHAAVFYVFFILLLPYLAEYLIIVIRNSYFLFKLKIRMQKRKIEKLTKKGNNEQKIEAEQIKMEETEKIFRDFKQNSERREENPYRIKLIKRDNAKWLFLIAILCFAMGLLTPLGDEPYTHLFKLMSGDTTASISEHLPLILSGNKPVITVFVLFLVILIFTDTKITLKDLFMVFGLTVMTVMSRRQFSLLLIIGVMSFTKLICDLINKYDKDGTEEFTKLMVTLKGRLLTIVLVVLCVYCLYIDKIDDDYIDNTQYPVAATDYLVEESKNGNINFDTMKIYNDYNYGSYLLYRGVPVFIDSRADLYSPEFNENCYIFRDSMNISSLSVYYEDLFKSYEMTHVITYVNSKLNMLLSLDDNYKELYKDDYFIIYERLTPNDESEKNESADEQLEIENNTEVINENTSGEINSAE